MDTGVTNFMVEIPPVTENRDVPADTPVKVDVLGDGRLTYTFRAGDTADPMTPRRGDVHAQREAGRSTPACGRWPGSITCSTPTAATWPCGRR